MAVSTQSRIGTSRQGDHVCALYENPDHQADALTDYIRTGLAAGERCVYVAVERSPEEICERLARAGVAVGEAIEARRLTVASKHETYLRDGSFDPDRMIGFLRETEFSALRDGCSGARISGEMHWALGAEPGCDRVIEYEARLNGFFPGSRSQAICQYNRSSFSPEMIRNVLRTHPTALIAEHSCSNPYYEAAHPVLTAGDAAKRVNWMLRQLVELCGKEQALQAAIREREKLLFVVSDELPVPLQALRLAVCELEGELASARLTPGSLTLVRAQLDRLSQIVDSMVDVPRTHAGRTNEGFSDR